MSHYRGYSSNRDVQVPMPGIFWDPREPPPPHLRIYQQEEIEELEPGAGLIRPPNAQQGHPGWLQYQEAWSRRPVDDDIGASPANVGIANGGFLPPVSLSVKVDITHDTARIAATQLFVNNTGSIIPKAGYTFPLPPESTVIDFCCRIGRDRVFRGKVRPKQEARDMFEDAVRKDTTAGLLEQISPDLFTTTLGNLPAGTRLKATLTFILLLKHGFRAPSLTFSLPTYIAPRYGMPPDDITRLIEDSGTVSRFSCSVDVLAPADIVSLDSPSHPSADIQLGAATRQRWADFVANRVERDPRCATVKLTDGTNYLDRDFTLVICTATSAVPETPFACIELHPELPNHAALMLTLPPNFLTGPQREYPGREIVFVADRSGSMSDKIHALRSAMVFFLASLPLGCNFNIWSFGSTFNSLWPCAKRYNPTNRQEAEMHVKTQFRANLGGTELLKALKALMTGRTEGFTDVIVLTDGQIWEQAETIDFISQARLQTEGRARFFSLGIGEAVSHHLVEGIAKAGGGYAEVIHNASQGGWEGNLLNILAAAQQPHVSPVSIGLERQGLSAEGGPASEILQSPHDISNLSPFMRNRVFMLLLDWHEGASPIVASVRLASPGTDEHPVEVPITALQAPNTTIHKFAARALLGDLERGESFAHAVPGAPRWGSTEEIKLAKVQGEKLGCEWSLASKWTSFVAIEERVEAGELGDDPFLDYDPDGPARSGGGRRGLNLLRPRLPENSSLSIQGATGEANTDQANTGQTGSDRANTGQNDSDQMRKQPDKDRSDTGPNADGGSLSLEREDEPWVLAKSKRKKSLRVDKHHGGGSNEVNSVGKSRRKLRDTLHARGRPRYSPQQSEEQQTSPRKMERGHPESKKDPPSSGAEEGEPPSKRTRIKAGIAAVWKRRPRPDTISAPSLQNRGMLSRIIRLSGSPRPPYPLSSETENGGLMPDAQPHPRECRVGVVLDMAVDAHAGEEVGAENTHTNDAWGATDAVEPVGLANTGVGGASIPEADPVQAIRPTPSASDCFIGKRGPRLYPSDPAIAEQVDSRAPVPRGPRGGYTSSHPRSPSSSLVDKPAEPSSATLSAGSYGWNLCSPPPMMKPSAGVLRCAPDFEHQGGSPTLSCEPGAVPGHPGELPPMGRQPSPDDCPPASKGAPKSSFGRKRLGTMFTTRKHTPMPKDKGKGKRLPRNSEKAERSAESKWEAASEVNAPTNNLPPSSALRFSQPVLTRDAVEQGKRELLKRLLPFQSAATGEFLATANAGDQSSTMESVLGIGFEAFVIASVVEYWVISSEMSSMTDTLLVSLSRTMAVATLLELHFSSWSSLCVSLSSKATSYLASKLSVTSSIQAREFARRHVARATFHLDGIPESKETAEELATLGPSSISIQVPLPKGDFPAEAGQQATEREAEGQKPSEESASPKMRPISRMPFRLASKTDNTSQKEGQAASKAMAVDRHPPSSCTPGNKRRISRNKHENLIRRLAAERTSRGEVGLEETGVPVGI